MSLAVPRKQPAPQPPLPDVETAAPSSKRPRRGVPPAALLSSIEADTTCSGVLRGARALLLHAGQPRRGGDTLLDVLRSQSGDVVSLYAAGAPAVLTALLEACV